MLTMPYHSFFHPSFLTHLKMIPSGHHLIIEVNLINTVKDLLQEKRVDNFTILCGEKILKAFTPWSILNLTIEHDIIGKKAEESHSESRQLKPHTCVMGRWVRNLFFVSLATTFLY